MGIMRPAKMPVLLRDWLGRRGGWAVVSEGRHEGRSALGTFPEELSSNLSAEQLTNGGRNSVSDLSLATPVVADDLEVVGERL
jgi:hypothetical protein